MAITGANPTAKGLKRIVGPGPEGPGGHPRVGSREEYGGYLTEHDHEGTRRPHRNPKAGPIAPRREPLAYHTGFRTPPQPAVTAQRKRSLHGSHTPSASRAANPAPSQAREPSTTRTQGVPRVRPPSSSSRHAPRKPSDGQHPKETQDRSRAERGRTSAPRVTSKRRPSDDKDRPPTTRPTGGGRGAWVGPTPIGPHTGEGSTLIAQRPDHSASPSS